MPDAHDRPNNCPNDGPNDRSQSWRQHWYPVSFVQDLPEDRPHGFAIHGTGYALFRDATNTWHCVEDRCPHRSARLSDGAVRDGKLECLYHGWQFGPEGRCTSIPQLAPGQSIPERAHLASLPVVEHLGMLWVWPGDAANADERNVPTVAELGRSDVHSVDFQIDLPYEQTFLIENVIDLAHIHIAHDGVRGGGLREMAGPIEFELDEPSSSGLRASFRSMGSGPRSPELHGAEVAFVAPNLVHYRSHYRDSQRHSGLALYSLPIGENRCRLLYRAYSNFPRRRDRLRPRWLEHGTQCLILQQDMEVVVGQAAHITSSEKSPRELWLPLKTSDTLVLAYRKWLDTYAAEWPHSVGFSRVRPTAAAAPSFDRQSMHTDICRSCSDAQRRARAMLAPLVVTTVALLATAAFYAGQAAAAAAGIAALLTTLGYLLTKRVLDRFR